MARRVNISDARKRLPTLFDRVVNREGEKVIISRRDSGSDAVLVSRSYVERLESQLSGVRKPFRLLGTARVIGSVDDVLAEIRASERAEIERRMARFTEPPRRRRR